MVVFKCPTNRTHFQQRGTEFGELMFSLSYLPTAERLTVVVVKARNLRFQDDRAAGDPFVKVYLMHQGKKIHKKKTSTKRAERGPIFNEAMIFSVPAHTLSVSEIREMGLTERNSQQALKIWMSSKIYLLTCLFFYLLVFQMRRLLLLLYTIKPWYITIQWVSN